jgi:uncharacterized protein YdiU (UPF0061 family)
MAVRHLQEKSNPNSGFDYSNFESIDGSHPWQTKVPGSHVLYRARQRKGGKVAWFNFDLAKEMKLIPAHHPHSMNPQLESKLLETFAIQIINEYDILNNIKIPPSEIKPKHYMATRYLQLQHPGKTGITSGDGRSLWNGVWQSNGLTWDITSCGTGATCLSPATHKFKKFFQTGDPSISYGCGYSDLDDGVTGAIFSEIMHKNGVPTERILCIIEFPGNLSINVRAGKNLLRPSHFFNHLKQSNLPRLQAAIDFFVDRELANGEWKALQKGENRYKRLLDQTSETFAEMAARFESEYIFCWLAWDGDNILANGGIIDYGSIRQFGLFHHEYKFDDVDRWSTTITEQRAQARYLVQTFAQIEHYINSGKKIEISRFRNHPAVRRFDRLYVVAKRRMLLEKIGLPRHEAEFILAKSPKLVRAFESNFRWWERKTKQKKHYRVPDGITKDALYSMRDILRTLPAWLDTTWKPMPIKEFMKNITSSFCSANDSRPTLLRRVWAERFQLSYMALLEATARHTNSKRENVIGKVAERSAIINRSERITGDAICNVGDKIIKTRKQMERRELFSVISTFIDDQVLVPGVKLRSLSSTTQRKKDQKSKNQQAPKDSSKDSSKIGLKKLNFKTESILKALEKVVKDMRYGL